MYHFFVGPEQVRGGEIQVTGADVNHIKNVLRMAPGELVSISDGSGAKEYLCRLRAVQSGEVLAEILEMRESQKELPCRIVLFQGLPKSDKMELIIQKAVELGVSEIVPVATARTVVRLDAKKEAAKQKRWAGIALSAAKQSGRLAVPDVMPVMRFAEALQYAGGLDVRLIPYELAEGMDATRKVMGSIRQGQSVGVFIGPEGGFAEEEIACAKEMGAVPITLGRRILRTETAGLATLSMLVYNLER